MSTRRGALQVYFPAPVAVNAGAFTERDGTAAAARRAQALLFARRSAAPAARAARCERFDARAEQARADGERARAVATRTRIAEHVTRRRRSDDDATLALVSFFVRV